MKLLPF